VTQNNKYNKRCCISKSLLDMSDVITLILVVFYSHKRDEFVEVMYSIMCSFFYWAELLHKKCIRSAG